VRVVSADGEQLGILPIAQALELARQREMDLVEVAAEAQPPVCRIMDFGKYKYCRRGGGRTRGRSRRSSR
jgi:translation initiation factor IF-3